MQFDASTPTKPITIAGLNLQIPQPFNEGHVCTEAEAEALNQLFAENVRNNFGGRVKKDREALTEGQTLDEAKVTEAYEAYLAEYEFGARRAGTRTAVSVDPLEREAISIAKDMVKAALKQQGHKLSDVGAEQIDTLARGLVEKNPAIKAEAQRRLDVAASIGNMSLEGVEVAKVAPTTEGETAEAAAAE